ncbi:MAG: RNA methyltransferase [Pseudomonadota bacterium]
MSDPRGYFSIGVEGISKAMNLGALLRTAHAFGASYAFTIAAAVKREEVRLSDTAGSDQHLPFFSYPNLDALTLPRGCQMVGIELTDEAIDLPSFKHPLAAAYLLGPERGSLSEKAQSRCDFLVKIPTRFCINVSLAGALVMYDRYVSMGRHAPRPIRAGGPTEERPAHVQGGQIFRRGRPMADEQGQ